MNALAVRALGGYVRTVSGLLLFLGTLGLVRTRFDGFVSNEGVGLLTFTGNPLTHLIHLVAGLAGVLMASRTESARRYALIVGAGGTAWGLLEFVLRDTSADIFGRDTGFALVVIGIGVAGLAVWAWSRAGQDRSVPAS